MRLTAVATFLTHGLVIIRNLATDPECILEVARRFGHVRETNFGRLFEVYSRPGSNDLAYRPVPLGAHTDNPYREPVPGVQLLHCLVNETTGGWSTLVDSLSVAQALQEEDPEGLQLLASTPVRFRFIDANEELIERRPIVQRDASGRMTGVHYSPQTRLSAAARRCHDTALSAGAPAVERALRRSAIRAALSAAGGRAHDVQQQPRAARPDRLRPERRPPASAGMLHRSRRSQEPVSHARQEARVRAQERMRPPAASTGGKPAPPQDPTGARHRAALRRLRLALLLPRRSFGRHPAAREGARQARRSRMTMRSCASARSPRWASSPMRSASRSSAVSATTGAAASTSSSA